MKTINILKDYVEGKISLDEYIGYLYNDKKLEALLFSYTDLPDYALRQDVNLYYYLISRRYSKTSDILESQNIIIRFLNSKGIDVIPTNQYKKRLDEEIKASSKKKYPVLKKKPKWMQNEQWPENNGIPLTFIGQLDITSIRHDTSFLYVFYDEINGNYITFEQSM